MGSMPDHVIAATLVPVIWIYIAAAALIPSAIIMALELRWEREDARAGGPKPVSALTYPDRR